MNVSSYLNELNLKLEHRNLPINNSIIVPLSFYGGKQDFKTLFGCLLNHILCNYFDMEGIFVMVRGYKGMSWFEAIGAKKICLVERSDIYGNVYIYYIKTKQFFGNVSVFNLMKEARDTYKSKLNLT